MSDLRKCSLDSLAVPVRCQTQAELTGLIAMLQELRTAAALLRDYRRLWARVEDLLELGRFTADQMVARETLLVIEALTDNVRHRHPQHQRTQAAAAVCALVVGAALSYVDQHARPHGEPIDIRLYRRASDRITATRCKRRQFPAVHPPLTMRYRTRKCEMSSAMLARIRACLYPRPLVKLHFAHATRKFCISSVS